MHKLVDVFSFILSLFIGNLLMLVFIMIMFYSEQFSNPLIKTLVHRFSALPLVLTEQLDNL